MGLMIDSCVFIKYERLASNMDFSKWESYGNAYISTITITELLLGIHLANNETHRLRRSAFVETIISEIPALDFTEEVARIHAEISGYLYKKN